MSMYGVERVLDELQAVLQAGLAEKLEDLDGEYKDGITLPVPTTYLRIFDPADQRELEMVTFPAVVLRPEPETVTDDPTLGGEYEVEHAVEVAFIVGYDSRARQETRLLRYMRAAKELLSPLDAIDAADTRYRGGGFARTWTTTSGVVRDVALVFTITTHETP